LVDLGLIASIFAIPLIMGGRQAMGQLVLVLCAAWLACCWGIYQLKSSQSRWVPTRAEPLLFIGLLLPILQIVNLPAETVAAISPQLLQILPLWDAATNSATQMGTWNTLSLTPAETLSGIANYLAYATIFFVTTQRIQDLADVERLLKCIAIATVCMATFGIVQYLTSNGKFFWFYEHPFTTTDSRAKGSFTNRNHFASFLALGIGPLLWWLVSQMRATDSKNQQTFSRTSRASGRKELAVGLLIGAVSIVAFATLLSLSRGGMLAAFVATGVCLAILYKSQLIAGKMTAGILGIAATLSGLLFVFGFDQVSDRLDNWEAPGRMLIWEANIKMASDFPILGTGVGSHRDVNPVYLEQSPTQMTEFTHAEGSYFQIASETGFVGLGIAVLSILLCLKWIYNTIDLASSQRSLLCIAAIAAGLCASFSHALFDFIWYAPGCLVIAIILAACACRVRQLALPSGTCSAKTGKLAWLGPLTVTAALLVLIVQTKLAPVSAEPHYHEYIKLTFIDPEEEVAISQEDQFAMLKRKMSTLTAAAKADPQNSRIQFRAAMGYLTLFNVLQAQSESPMTLGQIRDAALASEFESTAALQEWLSNVLGANRKFLDLALKHTRKGLQLSPTDGLGYLYLSQLAFLEGQKAHEQSEFIQQALKTRPLVPQIHFVAGREAWSAGELEQALVHWRHAFQGDVRYQRRLIDILADHVPPAFFVENFEPDWSALNRIRQGYQARGNAEHVVTISKILAEKSTQRAQESFGSEAAEAWLTAHESFANLNELTRATSCLERALESDPNSFKVRYTTGVWLYRQGHFKPAAEHFTWCSRRKPRDKKLQRLTKNATRASLNSIPRTATTPDTGGNSTF